MTVETLGEAWKLGWTCSAHCLWFSPTKGGQRMAPRCDKHFKLDMLTLVITRGRLFPLARMQDVMRCPRCGNMPMRVFFSPPQPVPPEAIAVNHYD
ncbi:MAG: hypothetical protein AB7U62_03090 [Pseudolabrys sp.]